MDPEGAWLREGAAIHGGDYGAFTGLGIINGPGFFNEEMMKNTTDHYQPGDVAITDNDLDKSIDQQIQTMLDFQIQQTFNQLAPPDLSLLGQFTQNYMSAPTVERVDPLVLDLDGDGVQLVHFDESQVVFDVDADGYLENTGWVSAGDGILVHDKNQDGQINDIKETISEYYVQGVTDGLAALKTLDENHDGMFNTLDGMWQALRVWQDANQNGGTDEGELKTLDDWGIASISLDREETLRERLAGNPVLSRSVMQLTNGTVRQVAAVDFTTNPIGYEFNAVFNGTEVRSQNGESNSFFATTDIGQEIHVADLHVNSAYGSIGNDTLIGDEGDNWLSGGLGADVLKGGAGNDLLIVDADDPLYLLEGGDGIDIVRIRDTRGVVFNLASAHVEVVNGGDGNDVLMGGGNSNIFINAGAGDDLIIGGAADDALAGEDGNDMIDGGFGDDIIRGHRGNDLLIGGLGSDYLDGGLDDDRIQAGDGDDVIIASAGNDTVDGGAGFDMVEYHGKYDQYLIQKTALGFSVEDILDHSVSQLQTIERLRFANVDITLTDEQNDSLPLPVKDRIVLQKSDIYVL